MSARTHALTLRQLEIFAAAAREGSFTRAAGVLLLSEAGVSQQVKQLETIVGARLFERSARRPVQLTAAGRLLLETCDNIFTQFESTLQEMDALVEEEAARVSFGVGTSFSSYLLPPIVGAFRQRYPGITVTVNIEVVGHWVDKVRRREVDLAVDAGSVDDPELSSVPLTDKELVWVGLAGHHLTGRRPAPIEALESERLILGQPNSSSRRALDMLTESHGVALRPMFELAGTEACLTAVISGMGIAMVPSQAVQSTVRSRGLAVLNVEGFPLRLHWSLMWRTNDLSPSAATFRDYLVRYLREADDQPVAPTGIDNGNWARSLARA